MLEAQDLEGPHEPLHELGTRAGEERGRGAPPREPPGEPARSRGVVHKHELPGPHELLVLWREDGDDRLPPILEEVLRERDEAGPERQ